MQITRNHLTLTLLGSICLLVGWGGATLLHECCHLAAAGSLGFPGRITSLTLDTGTALIYGDLPPAQAALIAITGSLGLLLVGVALVLWDHSPCTRMIGVIVLCRAWIDALPLACDGKLIAQGAGLAFAWGLALVEILVCGGVIMYALQTAPVQGAAA